MRNKLSDAIKLANRSAIVLGSIAAAAMIGVPSVAFAQNSADQIEEVMVTGIRGALKNAVDIKRNSTAIVDAVSAEDVGKLPDSDVGQTLGRIPGVSVGRAFGQGASISIRGSDPQMTYTTLNGQSVASTGWYDQQANDRSFNYSLLPSELIGGLEVYKTAQANLTEGGIGGTVIVKTRKPLDLEANTVFASVKGSIGTVSDDVVPEVSGLYSWKNDAETFGVLVAGAFSEGDYIRRGVEADSRWAGDVAPTTFVQERERTALDLNVQAKPTDDLEFGLHVLSMELVGDNSNTSHYIFTGNAPASTCSLSNANGICLVSNIPAANATDAFVQTWARVGKMTSDTYELNGSYTGEGFKVEAVIGKTEAEGGTSMTTNYSYGSWTPNTSLPKWTGVINATGKEISIKPASDQSVSVSDFGPAAGPQGSWATSRGPNSDEETYAQVDFTFDLDLGAIKSFKTGIRATEHEFEKHVERSVFKSVITEASTNSLYSGTIDMGTPGWSSPKPNIGAMMANTSANIAGWVEERPGYGLLNEENKSFYGMFTFEADSVRGNFGLRYINSDVFAEGYALNQTPVALEPGDVDQNIGWSKRIVREKADYDDVLPSVNVVFDLADDWILRASASQAITRANYENMFLAGQTGYQDAVAGNETLTKGDVGLQPMKASQADVGLEYYYGDGNMVSVTYFTKDISNFITTNTEINQSIGVVSPDSGLDSWTINEYVNAGGGEIDGLEIQINHAFDNGFGMLANYTYSNGNAPASSFQDDIGVFTLSSNHNANLVGYWESEVFSARAAYNWRSKYMVRETGWYGNRMHDAYGTLDLSFGWNITDSINLSLEATNVLEEDDVQYGAAESYTTVKDPLKEGYPAWSFMGEATYKLGVSFKF
jgi:iron complex outermembrane receptor protein